MSDLVAFLSARLGDDEATAKAASPGPWFSWIEGRDGRGGDSFIGTEGEADLYVSVGKGYHPKWEADQDFIARHDPARVLAEVEAKRAILAGHAPGYPVTYPKPSGQPTCGVCHAGGWDWEPENWPCLTVRALAAVYSDHPDYDPAWAPSPSEQPGGDHERGEQQARDKGAQQHALRASPGWDGERRRGQA